MITEAEFRHLLKTNSTVDRDKDQRLQEISKEIKELYQATLRSIKAKNIYNGLVEYGAEEFYELNEEIIQKEFLLKSRFGALGSIPKQLNEAEGDDDEGEGDDENK